jgi:PEP-CTERM motif-containing protein
MNTRAFLACFVMLAALGSPAYGAVPCQPGTWGSILGTTCSVGALDYTFTGFSTTLSVGGVPTANPTALTPGDISFLPTGTAFTLSVANDQRIESVGTFVDLFVVLDYVVVANGGAMLSSATMTGASYDVAWGCPPGPPCLSTGAHPDLHAQSMSEWVTEADPFAEVSPRIAVLSNTLVTAYTVANLPGGEFQILNQVSTSGGPFASGVGQITLFGLVVAHGGIALWDPQMTFGYALTDVTAVPEPQTYALLLLGLGMMGFFARRRRQAA